jgi:hypothetical protein
MMIPLPLEEHLFESTTDVFDRFHELLSLQKIVCLTIRILE